ncbi:hypothetical protein [Pectobacterium versatile]|uniref:hypothetical protein n=1 Tax=Pectobacterium versatile TaxID=2488639 RepID=UPI001CCF8172|nr:hypothetical protein [Pectobacterium versatile]
MLHVAVPSDALLHDDAAHGRRSIHSPDKSCHPSAPVRFVTVADWRSLVDGTGQYLLLFLLT